MGVIQHNYTQTVADGTATSVVRPSDWNSAHAYTLQDAVSLAGNTAGVLANISSGTLVLAGGNNVTLSQEVNSVTISAANQTAFVFSNSNGVSFGTNISTVTATVATNYQSQGAYLTTAMQSASSSVFAKTGFTTTTIAGAVVAGTHDTVGLKLAVPDYLTTAMASGRGTDFVQANAAFAGTNASGTIASNGISVNVAAGAADGGIFAGAAGATQTAGTVVWSNSNNVSFGMNASTITATATFAQSVQPVAVSGSNGSFAFSTVQFVTGNGASFYTDATGIRLSYSVPAQSTQPVAASGSNGSFLFSTLQFVTGNGASFYTDATGIRLIYTVPTATVFSNSNNVSFGLNGSTITATATVAQSAQTAGWYASSNTTLTSSGTVDARSLTVRAIGSLTAGFSAGQLLLSAPLALTGATVFSNSNNVSFGLNGSTVTATATVAQSAQTVGLYMSSNTALTSSGTVDARSMTVRGVGAATVGYSAGELVVNVAAGGGDAIRGIEADGYTVTTNTVHFANSNNISFGFGVGSDSTILTASVGLAASNSLGSFTFKTLNFSNANNVTFGTSAGSIITASVAAPGGGAAPTLDIFANIDLGAASQQQFAFSNLSARVRSIIVQPLMGNYDPFPGQITANTFYLRCSMSASAATMSSAHTYSVFVGVYTQNGSTLSLLNSVSTSWGSNAGNANLSTVFAGHRWLSIGSAAWSSQPVFTQGLYYWALMANTAGQNYNVSAAFAGNTIWGSASATHSGTIGVATVASSQIRGMGPWYGVYTVTSAALPASIGSNQLNKHTDVAIFNPLCLMLRAGPQTF